MRDFLSFKSMKFETKVFHTLNTLNNKTINQSKNQTCYECMQLHFQNEIQNSRNTSAQAGLYTGQIKKLKVSVPPIELQNQYAERVQVIEAQKVQAQASLAQEEDLFNSLLQKAFKGELV